MLYTWNWYNTINQLYFNKKKKFFKDFALTDTESTSFHPLISNTCFVVIFVVVFYPWPRTCVFCLFVSTYGFPGGANGKEPTYQCRRHKRPYVQHLMFKTLCSTPGSVRSLGEGNGNLFQYSCLKIPIDRGAWQTTVQRVAKTWTQLSTLDASHFSSTDSATYLFPICVLSPPPCLL